MSPDLIPVDVLLKATGDAPIMKKKKWAVEGEKRVGWVADFIRKYLKLDPTDSLVCHGSCVPMYAPHPSIHLCAALCILLFIGVCHCMHLSICVSFCAPYLFIYVHLVCALMCSFGCVLLCPNEHIIKWIHKLHACFVLGTSHKTCNIWCAVKMHVCSGS